MALTLAGIVAWRLPEGQAAQPTQAAAAMREVESTSTQQPTRSQAGHPTGQEVVPASATGLRRSTSASTASSQVVQDATIGPVPISTDHQVLIHRGLAPGRVSYHEMLESEPKDPTWAYDMEQRLRVLYESQGAQVYSIECRTQLCEVQSFSHRPDFDPHAVPTPREPGTITPSVAGGTSVNGRSTDLAYFRRDEIDRQMEYEAQRQARDARQR